jgi:hypothetical protein
LTQNNAGATGLNTVAERAGYLGVAPFVLCLAGVGLLPDSGARELLQRIALAWGAVLLAFSGAVHWGLALLVVGFGGFWLYEHRSLSARLPPAYLNLRRHLTLAICILLALTMFASDAAGLR